MSADTAEAGGVEEDSLNALPQLQSEAQHKETQPNGATGSTSTTPEADDASSEEPPIVASEEANATSNDANPLEEDKLQDEQNAKEQKQPNPSDAASSPKPADTSTDTSSQPVESAAMQNEDSKAREGDESDKTSVAVGLNSDEKESKGDDENENENENESESPSKLTSEETESPKDSAIKPDKDEKGGDGVEKKEAVAPEPEEDSLMESEVVNISQEKRPEPEHNSLSSEGIATPETQTETESETAEAKPKPEVAPQDTMSKSKPSFAPKEAASVVTVAESSEDPQKRDSKAEIEACKLPVSADPDDKKESGGDTSERKEDAEGTGESSVAGSSGSSSEAEDQDVEPTAQETKQLPLQEPPRASKPSALQVSKAIPESSGLSTKAAAEQGTEKDVKTLEHRSADTCPPVEKGSDSGSGTSIASKQSDEESGTQGAAMGSCSSSPSLETTSSPLQAERPVHEDISVEELPRRSNSNLTIDTAEEVERRDSIVSATEIVTSPGGTKTMHVALTQLKPTSNTTATNATTSNAMTSKPGEAQFPEKESEATASVAPALEAQTRADDDSDFLREDPSIDWKDMNAMEAEQDAMVARFSRKLELEREENTAHEPMSADTESVDSMEELVQAVKLQQQNSASNASLNSAAPVEPEPPVTKDLDLRLDESSSEKDRQIQTLQDQLMRALRGDCGVIDELDSSVAVDQRDAKIVDLAKKNRSLHLTLERDRLKARQLESKLLQAEESLRTCQRELQLEKQKTANGKRSGDPKLDPEQRREEKNSMRQLQQRVDSARLKAEQSSLESKRLRRLLIREVGEGPALDKVLESLHLHGGSRKINADSSGELVGWRGRAQQILKLKSKVKELSRELDEARHGGMGGNGERRKARGSDVDNRAMEDVKFIERGRRHSMQKLVHEMEEVEERLHDTRRKAEASRARNTVLESDNKKMREQMKVLLSKTTNDDALVNALRREIKRLRSDYSSAKGKVQQLETGTVSQLAYEELRQHSQSQAAQIERQDELLVKMRRQVESAQSNAGRKLVVKTNEELDAQAHRVNSKLLKVECDRLNELVDMFRRKLEEGMAEKESALVRSKAAEQRVVQLERRLGNIGMAGRKRQPPADQFLAMKDTVNQMRAENAALKERCARRIASKEEEIRVVRNMGEEMKRTYEEAITEMKRQVQMATSEAHRRASKLEDTTGSSLVQHLTHENEYLRGEISDLRDRQFSSSPTKYASSPKCYHSPYSSPNRKLLARPSKPYR